MSTYDTHTTIHAGVGAKVFHAQIVKVFTFFDEAFGQHHDNFMSIDFGHEHSIACKSGYMSVLPATSACE